MSDAKKPLKEVLPIDSTPFEGPIAGLGAVVSSMKHGFKEMGVKRTVQTLLNVNQQEGFDCPGCAWPDPKDRTMTEFCENGAKAVADEATLKRIGPDFFRKYSIPELLSKSEFWLGKQGRITHPMVRRAGSDHYEPIEWDDAFDMIAEHLNALDDPNEAIFYTSGRTSNEAAFLYQLFVRSFGTNNLPDCSNMCHESSGSGLGETIGIGKGTVSLEDFEKADAIFVIGQNPGTNHPRMLTSLQAAARRGCEIVSINPLKEASLVRFKHPQEVLRIFGKGTVISKLFLQVKANGDVALLKGIMKVMLEAEQAHPGEVFDHNFIKEHTVGFDAFIEALKAASWDDILKQSGISRAEIQQAAEIAMRSKATICCWAMGITQHKNGVANVQEIVNFLLLRGDIGKPGAGACPVRGHSNVQGDRTMGIWERPPQAFLDRLGAAFDFTPPNKHGFDTVEAIKAMHAEKASVFFGMGGNFLSATPDTHYTADAMRRCSLTVQVSTKLNRAHLVTGTQALILPCLGRTEHDEQLEGPQFVTVENSMGIVHRSQGKLPPASSFLLSEPMIVAKMAKATLPSSNIPWLKLAGDYDNIREKIEAVIPGFNDYNRRVRAPNGFLLPNPVRERVFNTRSGKAHFTVHPIPKHNLEDGQYLMMTIRSHDQYNTTIYGMNDRYRGIKNERMVVMMNAEDIAAEGFVKGQVVNLTSHFRGETRTAKRFIVVPYQLPRGAVATYFPEANVLVPIDHVADHSNTPASKSIVVTIHAA